MTGLDHLELIAEDTYRLGGARLEKTGLDRLGYMLLI